MLQRFVDVILSAGFLKLMWDILLWCWQHIYKERVTADLYIAFKALKSGTELEKCLFLVVRNDTQKTVAVDMFLWESRFWHRYIHLRKMRRIVVPKPILRVPAREAMQQGYVYAPGNLFFGDMRYFGVLLSSGKAIWVKSRSLQRALTEFSADFPDWRKHSKPAIPLEVKRYGGDIT